METALWKDSGVHVGVIGNELQITLIALLDVHFAGMKDIFYRSFIDVEHTGPLLHSLLQSYVFFGFTFQTDPPSPAIFYCNFFL